MIILDNKNVQNVITQKKINNNVNYKVQILAGHQIINSLYLSNLFNYKGDYEIESHMGWIKYTVGNHSEYKKARDSRNNLKIMNFLDHSFQHIIMEKEFQFKKHLYCQNKTGFLNNF